MPWFVFLAVLAYVYLLQWQIRVTLSAGFAAVLMVPYFAMKLGVLWLAISYWDSELCRVALHFAHSPHEHNSVGFFIVFGGAVIFIQEAGWYFKPVLLQPRHPMQNDNKVLILSILAFLVFPAILLFLAGKMVLIGQCAT